MKNKELKINQEVYFLDSPMRPRENKLEYVEVKKGKVINIHIHETRGHLVYKISKGIDSSLTHSNFTQEEIGHNLFFTKKDASKGAIGRLKCSMSLYKQIIQKHKEEITKIKTDPSCLFE